jgi:hypothetical protein
MNQTETETTPILDYEQAYDIEHSLRLDAEVECKKLREVNEDFNKELRQAKIEQHKIYPEFNQQIKVGDTAFIPVRVYDDSAAGMFHVETLNGNTKLLIPKSALAK